MNIFFKFSSIIILLFSVAVISSAQKTLKEGSVIYELTTIDSDSPEVQMMKGSRMNLYFNKKNQKFKISMMGGLVEIISITDIKSEESTILTNIMGNKAMVKMSKEQTEKQKAKKQKPDFEVVIDRNDKKEIVGYNCYKATLTTKDSTSVALYVTDEIKTKLDFFDQMFPGLNAFPLEYSIETAGTSLVFSAQEFKTKVDPDTFDVPTEGYPEMTFEEFEKQMAVFGGMGF